MLTATRSFVGASLFFVLLAASADTPRTEPAIYYDAAFFEQFAPRTAFDMVQRVPSFALRKVDEERRGFSGAAGNVLIDGKQPSAKSQSLEDILKRIPAAQVVRLEVLRGTQTAGDASGESVLVNVVRTPSAGGGFWSSGVEYAQQHEPAPHGNLAWAGRVGDIEYGIGAQTYALKRELPGTRRVTDGAGNLIETKREVSPREFEEYAINGEVSRDLFDGRFRATGQVQTSRYAQDNVLDRHESNGVFLGDELAPYSERKRTYELGTHFESAIDAWRWTVAGIFTRKRFEGDARIVNRDALSEPESEFQQLEARDTGESIVRTTFARSLGGAHQLQLGLEGALNTLDADLALTGRFDGGPAESIDVPNANMRVEEKRAEAFALHTWSSRPWSTEARLAAEYSELDFSGDANQTVDLSYLKPSFQLTRRIGERHQAYARIAREVGQLDFAEFASAVSLSDERIDGGNPDLKPQVTWRLELGADLRLGAGTAFGVRAYHDWIDDVVDIVALDVAENRISAPGNIGMGELYGLKLTFATPLSPLIPSGTLKTDATFQDTSVTDSITGRERTISEFPRNELSAEFRQDLQNRGLAWGVKYTYESSETEYRVDETDRTRVSPSLDVFVEKRVFNDLRLTITAVSVQGKPELRRRAFYDGDRSGSLLTVESTRNDPRGWLMITLSGAL
jgi:outer membrane receptor protein involved in Fe transport